MSSQPAAECLEKIIAGLTPILTAVWPRTPAVA